MRDLRAELEEWDGTYPAAWRPRAGDVLVGVVKGYTTAANQYGEVRVCTVAEEETGELVAVWLSSTVLLSLFKQHKPEVGERIGLKYAGEHPEKGYKLYALVVDREAGEPAFEPLGGEVIAPEAEEGVDYDPFGSCLAGTLPPGSSAASGYGAVARAGVDRCKDTAKN